MDNKQNTNSFNIVGRLAAANIRTGTAKNGHAYVSVDATITGEGDREYSVSFYASDTTSKNEHSKLYDKYMGLKDAEGKKVRVQGSFRENRYFSEKRSQMVSAQLLSGRFIDVVSDTESDKAEWELGGFVISELAEKTNKEGNIYRYDLVIGQANSQNKLSVFTVHVNPEQRDIINGVRGYHASDTIVVNGILDFTAKEVTLERSNEGGFGQPVVRSFVNHTRNFYITGGQAVIKDETAYDGELIRELVADWKAKDADIVASRKNNTPAVSNEPKISARQTSLI